MLAASQIGLKKGKGTTKFSQKQLLQNASTIILIFEISNHMV